MTVFWLALYTMEFWLPVWPFLHKFTTRYDLNQHGKIYTATYYYY